MHTLVQCIYSSVATPLFRDDGVEELLVRARVANAQADVTGILLYIGRGFFRFLKGILYASNKFLQKSVPIRATSA
jgi:hypothetical protein